MECKCGAQTQSKSSVVSKLRAELFFQECRQCSRVGIEYLKIDNVIVMRGKEAKAIFFGDLEGFINKPQQGAFYF